MNYLEKKPKAGYGFIYKYTSPQSKHYIGQTIRSLSERAGKDGYNYRNCTALYTAFKKYGYVNFSIEILEECLIEELDSKEIEYIHKFNSNTPNGYNIKSGGCGDKTTYNPRNTIVNKFDLNGNFIKTYTSLQEAAKDNNTRYQTISAVLRKERGHYKGYVYCYEGEVPNKTKNYKTQGRRTGQYTLEGNLIAIHSSANHAAVSIGKSSNAGRNIRSVCAGQRKTAYGYKWKYLD